MILKPPLELQLLTNAVLGTRNDPRTLLHLRVTREVWQLPQFPQRCSGPGAFCPHWGVLCVQLSVRCMPGAGEKPGACELLCVSEWLLKVTDNHPSAESRVRVSSPRLFIRAATRLGPGPPLTFSPFCPGPHTSELGGPQGPSWTFSAWMLLQDPGLNTDDSHFAMPTPAPLPESQTLPFYSSSGKSIARAHGRTPHPEPPVSCLSFSNTISMNGSPAFQGLRPDALTASLTPALSPDIALHVLSPPQRDPESNNFSLSPLLPS